jgi:hypothetical protein
MAHNSGWRLCAKPLKKNPRGHPPLFDRAEREKKRRMKSNDNKTTDKGNNIKGIKFILTIGRQHR